MSITSAAEGSRSQGRLAISGAGLAFPAILAWTALVNLPSFAYDDADDAFFLEIAHLWTQGHPPFVAAFDIKGLGFFAVLALAAKAFGATLATLKFTGIVFSALATTLLYRLCAKYDRAAAIVCAALYPILLVISGDVAYQVLGVFTLLAFLAAFSEGQARSRAIVAGLALGFACAIKQTCVVDSAALLYILCAGETRRADWPAIGVFFLAAASVAPLAFFLYYLANGAASVLIQDLVLTALNRGETFDWSAVPYWFANWMRPLAVVAAAALFGLVNARELQGRAPLKGLIAWLVLEILVVIAQRAGNQTGMTPLIAPMLLIGSVCLSARFAARGRAALALFAVLAVAQAVAADGKAFFRKMWRVDEVALTQAAAAIADTHPGRDDRLFVLNGPVWPNLAADLAPPTPYIHYTHVMCDFPGAGLPALIANFDAAPRYVVFENPKLRIGCETDPYAREIQSRLDGGYKPLVTARGERVTYQVYERSR